MKNLNILKMALFLILFLYFNLSMYAVPNSVRSREDYRFLLGTMRSLRIIVLNLGTDEQKKTYDDLKAKFIAATERHYSRAFINSTSLSEETASDNNDQYSVEMYYQLKIELNVFLTEIAGQYISRTKELLDSTVQDSMDILLEYSKDSGSAKYFYEAFDPLNDKKPYDPKKYHYYHKRVRISNNLELGYRLLEDARKIYLHPDYVYINSKKIKTSNELDFLLKEHLDVIELTRQAKKNGVLVHQLVNDTKLPEILAKYNINMGKVKKYPIYDDRIPEKFKRDAIDAYKLVYEIELNRIPGYEKPEDNNTEETQ